MVRCTSRYKSSGRSASTTRAIASRSSSIEPSTLCSASRFWGGIRSIGLAMLTVGGLRGVASALVYQTYVRSSTVCPHAPQTWGADVCGIEVVDSLLNYLGIRCVLLVQRRLGGDEQVVRKLGMMRGLRRPHDVDLDHRADIGMDAHGDTVKPGGFDGVLQFHLSFGDLDAFPGDRLGDVLGGHGAEEAPPFACLRGHLHHQRLEAALEGGRLLEGSGVSILRH